MSRTVVNTIPPATSWEQLELFPTPDKLGDQPVRLPEKVETET